MCARPRACVSLSDATPAHLPSDGKPWPVWAVGKKTQKWHCGLPLARAEAGVRGGHRADDGTNPQMDEVDNYSREHEA